MEALAGYNSESEDDTSIDETKKELSVDSLKSKIKLNMAPFVEEKKVGNSYCSFDKI